MTVMMDEKRPSVFYNRLVTFDVDDTLVRWVLDGMEPSEGDIPVPWPGGGVQWCTPVKEHILCLKLHKQEEDTVVVWSQGGAEWAESVVKTLGLNEFVDIVVGKPRVHYDDLPSTEWMGERRHIPYKVGSIRSADRLLKDDDE